MRDKLTKSLLPLILAMTAVGFTGGGCSGCEDEPKKKNDDVTVEPQRAKEVAPSGPLDKIEAPDSVMLYGGVDQASELAGHVSELMLGSPTQGQVQLDGAIKTAAMRLGLKDPSAIDSSKPIRFAVVDPKKHEQPYVVAVGIKSREDFVKTLPEKHKKDDSGNAFSYVTGSMEAVFVNYVDDWAVFTGHKDVFGAQKPFLVKLIGSTVKGDARVIVDVANLSKLYAGEMKQAFEDMKKSVAKSPTPMPMGGGMEKLGSWMQSIVSEVDKVVVTTNASKASGRLELDFVPKTGTELEKTFNALGARKLEPLLARLPADAPAALVASFDPDKATDLMRGVMAWSLQLSLGQNASEKDYSDAMNAYWKASSGDMALVAHKLDDKLHVSMLAGVRDAEGVEKAMTTMRKMYEEESLKKLYADMGIELVFKKDAYEVGKIGVDTIRTKFNESKDGKGKLGEQLAGAGMGIISKLMSHDFAITDDTVFSVYGDDGKKVMEQWIEGKLAGGLDKSPGMQQAMKGAAPGTFLMIYGSPLAVGQLIQKPDAPVPPLKSGIALSAGSTGNVVHVVLEVPADQAKELSKLADGLGGM